jgi:hypothetical protein
MSKGSWAVRPTSRSGSIAPSSRICRTAR